ncbi:MAG TPA: hypothetical protein K8V30_05895 [Metalysinibacillus jejuensis]|uniref:Zinc-ribbon domain-containing protein n=1 Tax=Metalysinibacillus jejuensis TaxID=914327 RepID=A0A921NB61_9BACL|nr:hypothetical protein [Metalysinibacillus jejuensis]
MIQRNCAQCGASVPKKASFCPTCGNDLTIEGAVITTTLKERLANKRPAFLAKEKMPVWKKRLLVAVIVVFVLLIAMHSTIRASLTPERQVTKLIHAYTNINTDKFFDMLVLDKDVTYDKKTYMKFLFNVDREMDGQFEKKLVAVAQEVVDTNTPKMFNVPATDFNDAMAVFEVRPLKKWGFYKTVTFAPVTYDTKIVTDMQGVKLDLLDNEYIFRGHDIELGKFLPGDYPYTVFVTNKWISRDYPKTLRVPNSVQGAKLDFMSWNQVARLKSNVPDSMLFINDEPTDKTVAEVRELGPIVKNTVRVYAEYTNDKGQKVRTATKYLKPGEVADLTFPTVGKDNTTKSSGKISKSSAESFVKRYRRVYERALNTNTIKPIETYLVEGSAYEQKMQAYFAVPRAIEQFKYNFISSTNQNTVIDVDKAFVTTVEEYYYTDADDQSVLKTVTRTYELHLDVTNNYVVYNVTEND